MLAAATAGGAAIAACGSQTRTVTISSAPHPSAEARSTATQTTASASSTTRSSTSSSSTATSTSTLTTTEASITAARTSSAPAFVGPTQSGGAALHAAVATLEGQGYAPTEPAQFHPSQTLEAMVGRKQSQAEGQPQERAFFFLNGKYLGTDASVPSAAISIVSEADTEVTLGYALYSRHGSQWQPTGGRAKVTFQLNNGKLVALQSIPPAHPGRGAGRL